MLSVTIKEDGKLERFDAQGTIFDVIADAGIIAINVLSNTAEAGLESKYPLCYAFCRTLLEAMEVDDKIEVTFKEEDA